MRYYGAWAANTCCSDVYKRQVYTQLIPELNEIRLKALINETIGDDVMVYIDEDVKYAARANLSMVENAMEKTLAYVYIGEGVGGAFLVNGRILMGAHLSLIHI